MANFNASGEANKILIKLNDQLVVDNFSAFGTGTTPANSSELDTLIFKGKGMTAANMVLTQMGMDVIVTFIGDATTSVTLTQTTIEQLENIAGKGNFVFAGQSAPKDDIDIWGAMQADSDITVKNIATFLNDNANTVHGLDNSNDIIKGMGGDDHLFGLSGNDVLDGGANPALIGDTLEGGMGNDIYIVDSIFDKAIETLSVKAKGGIDTVISSVDFTLTRYVENLTLTGMAAIGTGNSLANVVTDTISNANLYGAGGNDTMKGSVLHGGAGNDKLTATANGSILDGGIGDDTLIGGANDDIFYVDSIKDKIVETSAGISTADEVRSSLSFSLKSLAKVEHVTLLEGGNFNGTGNALDNGIFGNSGNNILDGGAGSDYLVGGAGDDILIGGTGTDSMDGGAGNDTYYIDSSNDSTKEGTNTDTGDTVILTKNSLLFDQTIDFGFPVLAGIENLTYLGKYSIIVFATAQDNILIGGSGKDGLVGLGGDDVLDGGKGNDDLQGGIGNDIYILDNVNDKVTELMGEGTDTIRASINVDLAAKGWTEVEHVTLLGKAALNATGNDLDNILTGNSGANKLSGGKGMDTLIGDAGNDILNGGMGDDILYGGTGNDIAVFNVDQASATVKYDSNQQLFTVTSAEGVDTLYGIETLQFLGGSKIAMPAIKDKNSGADTVLESAPGGSTVGITVSMVGTNVTYSLADDANGRFQIDSMTGIVTLSAKGLLDAEANATRTIIVRAVNTDNAMLHLMSEKSFTIKIGDDPQEIGGGEKTKEAGLNDIDLAALPANRGFRFDGLNNSDHTGYSLAMAGDINGDGYDDLIVGSRSADTPNGISSGSAYVVFGKAGGFGPGDRLDHLDGSNGFRIDGAATFDRLGISVAAAGDVNGDGFADLIVGAPNTDNSFFPNPLPRYNAGTSYVIFGTANGFAPVLDVNTLNGANGFALRGTSGDGYSGSAVSAAGDVNGDGYDDLAIGAPYTKINGNDKAGISHIVFGKDTNKWSGGSFDLNLTGSFSDGTDGIRLDGAAFNDQSGHAIAGVGDLNGDGFDEVLIGAPLGSTNGPDVGTSYLLFGGAAIAGPIALSSLFSLPGLMGHNYSQSGRGVAGIGDIDGDGFDDLAIASKSANIYPGSVFVVFGAANLSSANIDLATLNGYNGFRIDGGLYGAISAAGDVNGDGIEDVLIGAYGESHGASGSGSAYLIYGNKAGFDATPILNLANLTAAQGFRIDGAATGDYAGTAVAGGGDLNGDGFDDLVVGAPYTDFNASDSGSAYVIYGGNFSGLAMKIGTVKDDKLTGTINADILNGGLGNDILTGKGGTDVFQGGAGNDEFHIADMTFFHADGGGGVDTLSFDFKGAIGNIANRAEAIDILDMENGFADNAMVLSVADVMQLGADGVVADGSYLVANALRIEGDIGDTLHLTGNWSQPSLGAMPGYAYYVAGTNINLLVDLDIDMV